MKKILVTGLLLLMAPLAFAQSVSISDPYVREVPPGQKTSASFMTLTNTSGKEVALIKASSDVADNVELHEHVNDGGMMKMREVPKITVPGKGTRLLKPGGYHVMLIGLTRDIKAGDMVTITLTFDDNSEQTINAEVRKIMMKMKKGMMMGGHGHSNDALKMHVNPMPNLMKVYMKMGDQLGLSKEQHMKLKAGMKERGPKIQALTKKVAGIEAELNAASMRGDDLGKIETLANNLMQERLNIINGKAMCRESVKSVLTPEQFSKLSDLYRSKIMPKPMTMEQNKMAIKKHTNPMPNLMMVIKKAPEALKLSSDQTTKLKQWSDENGPAMAENYAGVIKAETALREASLNDAAPQKIAELADSVLKLRLKIIKSKTLCRDNMRKILDDSQYKKVLEIYTSKFS